MEILTEGAESATADFTPLDMAPLETDLTGLCPHRLCDSVISLPCFSWLSTRAKQLRLLESLLFAGAVAALIASAALPAFR